MCVQFSMKKCVQEKRLALGKANLGERRSFFPFPTEVLLVTISLRVMTLRVIQLLVAVQRSPDRHSPSDMEEEEPLLKSDSISCPLKSGLV